MPNFLWCQVSKHKLYGPEMLKFVRQTTRAQIYDSPSAWSQIANLYLPYHQFYCNYYGSLHVARLDTCFTTRNILLEVTHEFRQ